MIQLLDGEGRLGRYVRHITLKPRLSSEMEDITQDTTQRLYHMCYKLESIFVYTSIRISPLGSNYDTQPKPVDTFASLPSTVSSIGWFDHLPSRIVRIQPLGIHLRTLTLISARNIFIEQPLFFPHLEIIHMAAALQLLEQPWSCPRLRHMRLVYDPTQYAWKLGLSTGMQTFLQVHAEKLHTLFLDNASPKVDLSPSDLYLPLLGGCNNLQTLLLNVGVRVFEPGIAPLWILPSLECVAVVLEAGRPVPFMNVNALWDGFHAHGQFLGIKQFLVLHPHGMHDSADLEPIKDHCGHDRRLSFRCLSNYVV
ncbi:hypothetical protein M408DRAFT_333114 [Serendipita vermifera MAFF 305830]|uniref:Uncharacterized protein n=1 Tax=Serendipita vermifera MAFF 305830 TaxID=933852 RepID=A0A0C3API7_SERVB|nr:hypothetical protein M408DRAFT_333114 [Serendipita vermifera MAFF 305830]